MYLRNAWYVAAWSGELAPGRLVARTLLDEPVVLFRDDAGDPCALLDRCPHRFAPLSLGKLMDGGARLACPYHGLQFDREGVCRHNPHGAGAGSISVRAFLVVERYGVISF